MHTIHSLSDDLTGVSANNPDVKLQVSRDEAMRETSVLVIDYPAATDDAAGRDIWCDADVSDWSHGAAIIFQIKAAHPEKLSVSFFDRNRVVYTSWIELEGGSWQAVRLPFANLRPNPYFQPPDALIGRPLDVSDVNGIALSPQNPAPGQLTVTEFIITN